MYHASALIIKPAFVRVDSPMVNNNRVIVLSAARPRLLLSPTQTQQVYFR